MGNTFTTTTEYQLSAGEIEDFNFNNHSQLELGTQVNNANIQKKVQQKKKADRPERQLKYQPTNIMYSWFEGIRNDDIDPNEIDERGRTEKRDPYFIGTDIDYPIPPIIEDTTHMNSLTLEAQETLSKLRPLEKYYPPRNPPGNFGGPFRYTQNNDTFTGHFKEKYRNGMGVLVSDQGGYFFGTWHKDTLDGRCRQIYPDGSYYEGDMVLGYAHGNGKLIQAKKLSVYEGSFRKGLREGQGTIKYSDGSRYEGQFHQNQKDGFGHMKFQDGSSYSGNFKRGKFNGHGEFKDMQGNMYSGEWVNDMRNGKGTFTAQSGETYKGEFVNDKKDGFGLLNM